MIEEHRYRMDRDQWFGKLAGRTKMALAVIATLLVIVLNSLSVYFAIRSGHR